MDLGKIFLIIQVVISVLLVLSVLLQSRGASLGEAFGGGGTFYGSRRGSEQTLFVITVILAVLFVVVALLSLFV